tara:strand:+ start:9945 stop:12359 length:2415 start_codon:yes stop_codon:yes gene_type:complete
MPTEIFEVRAVGKDEVTAELKRVQRAMGKLEKDLKSNQQAATGMRGAFQRLTKGADRVATAVRAMQAAFAASVVVDFGRTLFEAGKQGAQVADQFQILQGRIANFPQLMDQARAATANMIPDEELQTSIATFDSFDIPLERIPQALEQVSKTALRTGQDAAFLANSLSTGIARVSPQILDNLGIQVKLSQATAAASKQFKKQASELTEVEKKTALLNLVLDNLAEKNKDIEFLEQRTAIFNRIGTAIENAKTSLGIFVADVLNAYDSIMGRASTATDDFSSALEDVSDAQTDLTGDSISLTSGLSNLIFGVDGSSEAMAQQAAAVRAAGAALQRLPVDERRAAFDRLMATFSNIPHGLRLMIAELGGVSTALQVASINAQALTFDFADLQGHLASGGAPAAIRNPEPITLRGTGKKTKRRRGGGGGGGGRRKGLLEDVENAKKLLEMNQAQSEADRITLETNRKIAEIEQKSAQMAKTRIKQAEIELFVRVETAKALSEQADKLDKIDDEAEDVQAEERKRAASLALINEQLQAGNQLRSLELQLATTADPLLRAELDLQLQKARIMAEMRQINESEEDAAIKRAEAQHRLNMAMVQYGETVRAIELAEFTERMTRASAIASNAAAELKDMHIGMSSALDTASTSVKAITQVYAGYERGQLSVGQAVTAATAGMGAAVAGQIDDERTRAGVLAAIEAAMSVAAFARLDIPAGIAHLTAASMFGAVAGGAGGGGGGGGGGAASAGAAAPASMGEPDPEGGFGSDGGRQVIVQFGSGVILGDPQAVADAVDQAEFSARGTGNSAGY